MSAVAVLTTGASPSTVTVSDRPPTSSATSTLTVSLTFSTMPLRVTVLKPDSATSTTVVADRQELEAVGADLVGGHGAGEAGLDVLAVTVTPGSAPPLVSVTVPTIVAAVTCALATDASGSAMQDGEQREE